MTPFVEVGHTGEDSVWREDEEFCFRCREGYHVVGCCTVGSPGVSELEL